MTRLRHHPAVIPSLIVAVILLTAVLALLTSGRGPDVPLDPDSYSPRGAHAVAGILSSQGVSVDVVRSQAALDRAMDQGPATVLVSRTDLLNSGTTADLERAVSATADELVLVDPDDDELGVLAPDVETAAATDRRVSAPDCDDNAAVRAGTAAAGGATFRILGSGTGCYPVDGHPSYVVDRLTDRAVVLIGQPWLLTNELVAADGNASLVVATLGQQPRLVWYVPNPLEAAPSAQRPLSALLPRWVRWATADAVVAVLIAMLWRGRRLGALVSEPLPVIVRSVETTKGRARLYRRSRSPARAAETLRTAALTRLRAELRQNREVPLSETVTVAAGRSGRQPADVAAVLAGPPPADDAALVRLAAELDRLDREVRRS